MRAGPRIFVPAGSLGRVFGRLALASFLQRSLFSGPARARPSRRAEKKAERGSRDRKAGPGGGASFAACVAARAMLRLFCFREDRCSKRAPENDARLRRRKARGWPARAGAAEISVRAEQPGAEESVCARADCMRAVVSVARQSCKGSAQGFRFFEVQQLLYLLAARSLTTGTLSFAFRAPTPLPLHRPSPLRSPSRFTCVLPAVSPIRRLLTFVFLSSLVFLLSFKSPATGASRPAILGCCPHLDFCP